MSEWIRRNMITNSPVKVWRKQKEISSLLGKRGKIVSYTIIRVPPLGFEKQAPYPVILVEFKDGTRKVGQLVSYEEEDLKFGREVEIVYRRIKETEADGVIQYGVKFRPK